MSDSSTSARPVKRDRIKSIADGSDRTTRVRRFDLNDYAVICAHRSPLAKMRDARLALPIRPDSRRPHDTLGRQYWTTSWPPLCNLGAILGRMSFSNENVILSLIFHSAIS